MTKQEEFKPKHTYHTVSKPCVIRGTEMELGWIGKSGEPARGLLYDTRRFVHDNPKNMTRTIQHAPRAERRMATPMDERFRVLFREEMLVRRLARAAGVAAVALDKPLAKPRGPNRKHARQRKHHAARKA